MSEVHCNGAGEMPGHEGEGSYDENYDNWYDCHLSEMEEFYIKDNPEEFATSESMVEIENNPGFQSYADTQWEIFLEGLEWKKK